MTFLGPLGGTLMMYLAIGAAALAIGAYIIKMRRRRFEVPFSHLWKRVLEQKDANALWKQLKRFISLILILVILGIFLFAALDPTLDAVDREARNVVIIIDASASMKAMDGAPENEKAISRMDAAKQRATELIDGMGGGDLAMVMKADGQATPLSRFTSDKALLRKIVNGTKAEQKAAEEKAKKAGQKVEKRNEVEDTPMDRAHTEGVEASDTPADLSRALAAAADALRDRPNPLIVLVSDGAYPEIQLGLVSWEKQAPAPAPAPADPKAKKPTEDKTAAATKNLAVVDLAGIDVRYLPVGRRSDNVGIVAFNVRRYIANKAAYEVFVEVQNFGSQPANRMLSLYNGETAIKTHPITLPPNAKERFIYEKVPGTLDNKLRAVLRPGQGGGQASATDAFPLDDTAYALLPVIKKQKVLMVTDDNLFLEAILLVYDNVEANKVTPAEYDDNPLVADGFDVVIFDEHTPKTVPLPPTSLLYFHPSGEHSPIQIVREVQKPKITETDEDHPVMRWVTLSDVYMDKSAVFAPIAKKGESGIAYFTTDPLIASKRDGRRKVLAFGFSLPAAGRESATDLPMRVAFPMMLVNALDWFAGDNTDLLTTYPTGSRQRIPLDGIVNAHHANLTGPDGKVTQTPIIDGLATFYGSQIGYYEVEALDKDGKGLARIQLAANLSSPSESDIAPSTELSLGGKKLEEPPKFKSSVSRHIWTILIAIAMALIVMEWITYHRRITV